MIFVTVGTHYQGFPRLVRWMDDVAAQIDDEVIMQLGETPYHPRNATGQAFFPETAMRRLIRDARWVVCHAGAGTLLTLLRANAPTLCVPRRRDLREHMDDHQRELAYALAREDLIRVAEDRSDLEEALQESPRPRASLSGSPPLRAAMAQRVASLREEVHARS